MPFNFGCYGQFWWEPFWHWDWSVLIWEIPFEAPTKFPKHQISKSVNQLYTIRLALRASLLEYQDKLAQQQRQTPLL
jgi:hypothetical protein